MFRYLTALISFLIVTTGCSSVVTKNIVFTGTTSEHKWELAELDPNLPSDWSSHSFLVMDLKASSTQRFFLKLYAPDGERQIRLQLFGSGVWSRVSVPLRYFLRPGQEGNDLASIGNKSRDSFWMGIVGPFGPLTAVEALGVTMQHPLGQPTLEIRAVHLANEDPGSEILEKLPVVDEFGQWAHGDWPRKVTELEELKKQWAEEDASLASAGPDRCKYGGFPDTTAKATGFFRVEKIGEKWWIVDPDGHLFLSAGANCMSGGALGTRTAGRESYYSALPPEDLVATRRGLQSARGAFYSWNLLHRHGPEWKTQWMDTAVLRMQAWGLNTIGNWSDPEFWDDGREPYEVNLRGWGSSSSSYLGLPDVYSEDFERVVDEAAKRQCAPRREDPYLLGYFLGNEPGWPGREAELVDMVLEGPDSGFQRKAKEFLAEADTPERRTTFVLEAFQRYLDIINKAIRKHDPNHLNLGLRFGGHPPEYVIKTARGFDVYSLNSYADDPLEKMEMAYELTGRPILIGEFHIGVPADGLGAGLVQAADQHERGIAYRYYVEQAASHNAFVGANWFQWIDSSVTGRGDGENYNIGFVDVTDRPYVELIEALKVTHERLLAVHAGHELPFSQKARKQ
jgi:hypothetical protein